MAIYQNKNKWTAPLLSLGLCFMTTSFHYVPAKSPYRGLASEIVATVQVNGLSLKVTYTRDGDNARIAKIERANGGTEECKLCDITSMEVALTGSARTTPADAAKQIEGQLFLRLVTTDTVRLRVGGTEQNYRVTRLRPETPTNRDLNYFSVEAADCSSCALRMISTPVNISHINELAQALNTQNGTPGAGRTPPANGRRASNATPSRLEKILEECRAEHGDHLPTQVEVSRMVQRRLSVAARPAETTLQSLLGGSVDSFDLDSNDGEHSEGNAELNCRADKFIAIISDSSNSREVSAEQARRFFSLHIQPQMIEVLTDPRSARSEDRTAVNQMLSNILVDADNTYRAVRNQARELNSKTMTSLGQASHDQFREAQALYLRNPQMYAAMIDARQRMGDTLRRHTLQQHDESRTTLSERISLAVEHGVISPTAASQILNQYFSPTLPVINCATNHFQDRNSCPQSMLLQTGSNQAAGTRGGGRTVRNAQGQIVREQTGAPRTPGQPFVETQEGIRARIDLSR